MRKTTVMISDEVFEAIEEHQRKELEKGNKVSISHVVNKWLCCYLYQKRRIENK